MANKDFMGFKTEDDTYNCRDDGARVAIGGLDSRVGIAESRITNLQSVTNQLSNNKADISSLGTSAYKNSTSVVTSSSDLVESGGVRRAIGIDFKNFCSIARTKRGDGEARRVEYNIEPIPQGTYIFSSTLSGNATSYGFDFRNANSEQIATVGTGEFTSKEITFTEEVSKLYTYISENDYNNGRYLLVDNIMVSKDGGAYEPYHASVEQTMRDAQFIQGKNYLPNDITTQTVNGIAFAVQEDGTVIANGTASADWARVYFANNTYLPVGNYLLSGVTGGATTTYRITLEMSDGTSVTVFDGDTAFTITEGKYINKAAILIRQAGYVANNVVFKPMVRKATESDPTYEPYYTPLKDVVPTKVDNSVIGTVEDGATASKAWSVGEHFIKDGAFKEVTQAIASGGAINDSNTVNKPIADLLDEIEGTVTPSQGITLPIANNRLVRRGNRVSLNLRLVNVNFPTAGTVVIVGTIPDGFQPKTGNTFYCAAITDNVKPLRAYVGASRNIGITSAEVLTDVTISLSIVYYIN